MQGQQKESVSILVISNRCSDDRRFDNTARFWDRVNIFWRWRGIYHLHLSVTKLEGVGPVDKRPSSDQLHHFEEEKKRRTNCNNRYVTRDMWHVTCDTWWGVNILSKFHIPSSYTLGLTVSWRLWTKGRPTEWMDQLIKDEGVYRTAPARPMEEQKNHKTIPMNVSAQYNKRSQGT